MITNEAWDRIVHAYEIGTTIPELAIRFRLTNQAIRYVLTKRNVLKKGKPKCGLNASTN